ncbi:MAG: hypothetical protein HY775_09430 [Acidobacteria bacterium]|nr:hypothetical protein [Acidobacteriota bacterium]
MENAAVREDCCSWNKVTGMGFEYHGLSSPNLPHANGYVEPYSMSCLPYPECGTTLGLTLTNEDHVIVYYHTDIASSSDMNYKWYIGESGVPAGPWDMWGTLTHELSHWIKLRDLYRGVETQACPGTVDDSSMCSPMPSGTARYRSPTTGEDVPSVASSFEFCRVEDSAPVPLCTPVPSG